MRREVGARSSHPPTDVRGGQALHHPWDVAVVCVTLPCFPPAPPPCPPTTSPAQLLQVGKWQLAGAVLGGWGAGGICVTAMGMFSQMGTLTHLRDVAAEHRREVNEKEDDKSMVNTTAGL